MSASVAVSVNSHSRVASPIGLNALAAIADIDVADRVVVIGRKVIEQVVAAIGAGCRNVLSLRAGSACPRGEAVDVLWLAGLEDGGEHLAAILASAAMPRIVVVELGAAEAESRLRPVYRQLRAKGFVRFATHRTHFGVALVAARPAWLHCVH